MRSADLSRQVGAVIAKNNEILSTGANDCPCFGGGLYWPAIGGDGKISDKKGGRDYTLGYDSNRKAKADIIKSILELVSEKTSLDAGQAKQVEAAIGESRIKDLTEYGRSVHAEMEAILACARSGVGTRGCTLYCTTFPCHNCAKHIIAAGIERVVYIEPYPKSKAFEFHKDSICQGFSARMPRSKKVVFEPFVGIGPRRFFDLFSTKHGSGYQIDRKDDAGNIGSWEETGAPVRIKMPPWSYLDNEGKATVLFQEFLEGDGDAKERS